MTEPQVTVIVVTWQGADLLDGCLDSLAGQTVPHRVLVVDNASTDGTAALLAARQPPVEVITLASNTGFAGGIAAALPLVTTRCVALLNNDAAAEPDWLEQSLAALGSDPDTAAVTARMLLWPEPERPARINNAGVCLVKGGYGTDRGFGEPDGAPYDEPAEVFGFSGGAAVLRTDAVRAVGGMPAAFFLYYEDTDLAWRLRLAGWRIRYEPQARVFHRHAATTDLRSDLFAFHTERNRLLMLVRCAPVDLAFRQLVRFCATTASLQLRRAFGQDVGDARVFALRVRLRVIGSVLARLPSAIQARRGIEKHRQISRRAVAQVWIAR
jgi:hypothetical protein